MAVRQPLNLGGAQSLAYGLTQQPNMQLPPELAALLAPKQAQEAASPPGDDLRGYAVAQALAQTPRVQGNSIVEALGAALQGGLAGREARREHERQIAATTRQDKLADAENAQQMQTWQEHEEDRARADEQRSQMAEILSGLPDDQRALATLDPEGYVRGMMRNRFPAPTRGGSGVNAAPELPSGFVWEN